MTSLPDSLEAQSETVIPNGGRAIAFPAQRLRIAVVESRGVLDRDSPAKLSDD